METSPEIIYGRWAVLETLRAARRKVKQLVLAEGIEERGIVLDLIAQAQQRSVPVARVPRRMVDDMVRGVNHQGVVLRVGPYQYVELDDVMAVAKERDEKPFLLFLFPQFCTEYFQGIVTVLSLIPLRLTRHNNPGWLMQKPDCR